MRTKRVEPWVVTDDFWARREPLRLPREAAPGKTYARKPGAGRPAKLASPVFEAVVYVVRTGCQWKASPSEDSASVEQCSRHR